MADRRRAFKRPLGERTYKKLFLIVTEGKKTEPRYFDIFQDSRSVIRVKCKKGDSKSSPPYVLKRMARYLREETFLRTDEAWLVVDKDQWSDDQLQELHVWAQNEPNYNLALSNPKFEFWLLLHFEDGQGISNPSICSARLKRHLPGYDKDLDIRLITLEMIDRAIQRAKLLDRPPCLDWPKHTGSTVYRLVESILSAKKSHVE